MTLDNTQATQPQRFFTALEQGIIRCDGSMGYLLARHGASRNESFDYLNLSDPQLVADVHRSYLDEAGVNLLQTNTFGANRLHLATFGKSRERLVQVVNKAGVDIAREVVAGTECMVGGSVGPLTHATGDWLSSSEDDGQAIEEAYIEQIKALGDAGVDVFVIETVHRFIEGITALKVAKQLFPNIPVVFQAACTHRGQTVAGDDIETLIRAADEVGADVLGLNCFLDPAAMYSQLLDIQTWTQKPMAAQPNVGKRGLLCQGVFEADRSLRTTVNTFSVKMIEAGVRLIGGCCGITPQQIQLVKKRLDKMAPESFVEYRSKHLQRFEAARQLSHELLSNHVDYEPTRLEADLRSGDPTRRPILVEVDPPRAGEPLSKFIDGAVKLAEAGVKVITIADNPGRVPRMDRNVFANLLRREIPDIELILHIACADQTRVTFETELESLKYISRNVLVISGDPPRGEYARSSAPYDFRSVSAIRAFARRNHGFDNQGERRLEPTHYFVGGALNPAALKAQMRKFWTKSADAGASFCMTQPIFDESVLSDFHSATIEFRERLQRERSRDCFFIPGVMSIVSARNAKILRKGFGMPISQELIAEFEQLRTRKACRKRGREITRNMMSMIREKYPFQGLYVVTQFHNYKSTIADLRDSGWLQPSEPASGAEAES